MLESPNDKATTSQGFSIPGLTPSSQSIPAQPMPVQGARSEVFTLQPPTLLPRIFPSTLTNQLTNSGGQYDAMLLAVFASAPVEAHLDSYPWRDILTQYLYEGSRSIASTKLTPSDFNFTKFKAVCPIPHNLYLDLTRLNTSLSVGQASKKLSFSTRDSGGLF